MKKFQISNFKFQIFFLFTIHCSLFTAVSAATVDEVVENIQKKYNGIQDVRGKFLQTSYLKDLDRIEKYEGKFFMSKKSGTKMKWTYTKPRDEEVVINDPDIWVYKKSEKQALKGKFSKDSYGQVPLSLLGSIGNLRASFDITMSKEDTLELKPKRQLGIIKKILLVTKADDFPIKSFTVFDAYGNKVDITVKDTEVNLSMDESLFIFKAPSGVEVFEFNP